MRSRNDPFSPAQERDAASGLNLLPPEPRSLITRLSAALRECLKGLGEKAAGVVTSMIKSLMLVLLLGSLSLPLLAQQAGSIGKEGISFDADVSTREALLNQGDYFIQHVAEGADHVFVFKGAIRRNSYSIEPGKEIARVRCQVEAARSRRVRVALRH